MAIEIKWYIRVRYNIWEMPLLCRFWHHFLISVSIPWFGDGIFRCFSLFDASSVISLSQSQCVSADKKKNWLFPSFSILFFFIWFAQMEITNFRNAFVRDFSHIIWIMANSSKPGWFTDIFFCIYWFTHLDTPLQKLCASNFHRNICHKLDIY